MVGRQIEEQDAATEHLALVNRLECACCGDLLGIHPHFQIARLKLFHAAIEYDAAAVDEHEIGQDVLDLFHLMRGYDYGAISIEVAVQQAIVELLAIEEVKAKSRLVPHHLLRLDSHYQRQGRLCHQALQHHPDSAGGSYR